MTPIRAGRARTSLDILLLDSPCAHSCRSCSAQTSRVSFATGVKLTTATNGTVKRTVCKVGNWAPGSDTPAYLENLTGSYGFDPLGLGKDPASLARFQEAEVIHGRWAMLGVAGSLGAELAGQGDWYSAPLPLMSGGHAQYLGAEVPFDLGTLAAIEFALMAGAESMRGGADASQRIYPGGSFDPMGMVRPWTRSPGHFPTLSRTRSLTHSRSFARLLRPRMRRSSRRSRTDAWRWWRLLALSRSMLVSSLPLRLSLHHVPRFSLCSPTHPLTRALHSLVPPATGASPLAALSAHLADPMATNFATNGVSLPF